MRWVKIMCTVGLTVGAFARAGVPEPIDPKALVAQGTRIGTIHILPGDVFDLTQPGEDRRLYRIANALHVDSREQSVRRVLLFEEGELLKPRLLAETERLLRAKAAFQDASVRVVAVHDGLADIEVHTRDLWSLELEVSYGRSGGQNKSTYGIKESNLLGTGYLIEAGTFDSVDRSGNQFGFATPEFGRQRWQAGLAFQDNSDGHTWSASVERPFYAFDTSWAVAVRGTGNLRDEYRYELGERREGFEVDAEAHEVVFGKATDLGRATPEQTKALRWTVGIASDQATFQALPGGRPEFAASLQDRDLVYPFVGIEFAEDKFGTTRNRDLIGRTEDIQLGWQASVRVGASRESLGAADDAWIYRFALSRTVRVGARATFGLEANLSGRRQDGHLRDALSATRLRYDYRWNDFTTTHVAYRFDIGRKLDEDHTLFLGADTGLRGYPLRYASGDRLSLFTAEQRFYTEWYPWRLFRVGGAIFVDAGAARFDGRVDPTGDLVDAGIGLRLFNTRGSLGKVIHIDLAAPLNGGSDLKGLQWVVRTEATF
ncbi:MAG: hypothetical protein IPK97_03945 [Ahniella sp.]|nr:hypothetical protein [Ahniella sp.]